MKDLSITSRKIVITEMQVPTESGGMLKRQVEVVLRTPSTPQSLRIMLGHTMMNSAHEVFVSSLQAANEIQERFYEEVGEPGENGKRAKVRRKLSLDESRAILADIEKAQAEVDAAENILDTKRREFYRSCFSFIESVRTLENKRPVLFDFGWADGPKTWDKMTDDDKEILCDFDSTIAIGPVFEILRSGASAEELGK